MTDREAYEAGRAARRDKKPRSTNPHDADPRWGRSVKHDSWEEGYLDQKRDELAAAYNAKGS